MPSAHNAARTSFRCRCRCRTMNIVRNRAQYLSEAHGSYAYRTRQPRISHAPAANIARARHAYRPRQPRRSPAPATHIARARHAYRTRQPRISHAPACDGLHQVALCCNALLQRTGISHMVATSAVARCASRRCMVAFCASEVACVRWHVVWVGPDRRTRADAACPRRSCRLSCGTGATATAAATQRNSL
jgi:hypothetical protein